MSSPITANGTAHGPIIYTSDDNDVAGPRGGFGVQSGHDKFRIANVTITRHYTADDPRCPGCWRACEGEYCPDGVSSFLQVEIIGLDLLPGAAPNVANANGTYILQYGALSLTSAEVGCSPCYTSGEEPVLAYPRIGVGCRYCAEVDGGTGGASLTDCVGNRLVVDLATDKIGITNYAHSYGPFGRLCHVLFSFYTDLSPEKQCYALSGQRVPLVWYLCHSGALCFDTLGGCTPGGNLYSDPANIYAVVTAL